ncbi:MAG: 50S ribosomal protein L25 [Acidimicrobiales bacterium]
MAEITLKADIGRPTGSRASGRLRASGRVPGVVYGLGQEVVAVSVAWKELRHVLTTDAGLNALIDLELDGSTDLVMVKELQRHPVRRDVLHVDFLRVSADQPIEVDVPISLRGEATAVAQAEGVVDHLLYHLRLKAKPADIPNELTVDISGLQLGDTIRVGDLTLPSGVTTEVDAEDPVVTTSVVAEEAPPEEEIAEEEAEAAEGEAAEGAPAEGGEAAEGEG